MARTSRHPANVTDIPPGATARTIGGRATEDEILLIDRACVELRTKRGKFLVQAAVEAAAKVLEAA